MTDTPAEVARRYREQLLRRPGEERLEMACRMFDSARSLVRASLGDPDGTDESPAMKALLLRRTYGRDLGAAECERLVHLLLERGRG